MGITRGWDKVGAVGEVGSTTATVVVTGSSDGVGVTLHPPNTVK